jgi:membrane fusion protein, heavy metal efflux system
VVRRGNSWLPLVFLCLVACDKAPNSTSGASDPRRPGELKLAEVSRQFLKIEPVGAMSSEGAHTYFGRTAFRPKALSAVTAPFAGRVAEVLVEPGQRVRAGAPLFALESADVLQARANLEQARLKQRLTQEVLAR